MSTYPYFDEASHLRGTVAAASRTTADSGSSHEDRQKLDAVDKVFMLEPSKHPLMTLFTNVGRDFNGASYANASIMKAETTNSEFSWHEGFYGGKYATISSVSGTTGALTLGVTGAGTESAYIFTKGDVVKNARTGENFIVATVASTTTITVAADYRVFGTTAAATPEVTDGLYIVGNAAEENASARNINVTRTSKQSNFTQIFKRTIGVSGTEEATALYGGPDLIHLRRQIATEHAEEIERAMWWGEKKSTTGANGNPLRATGGILEFINSNNAYVQDQGGPLTSTDFATFLSEGFTYGSPTKTLFVGGIVSRAIDEFAMGQIQTKVGDRKYGLSIREWETSSGTVRIVRNPLFVQDYAGYAFLLDLDCFRLRHLKGRDTKLLMGVQSPDVDGKIDQFITEIGLERKQAARCALLKGVTD